MNGNNDTFGSTEQVSPEQLHALAIKLYPELLAMLKERVRGWRGPRLDCTPEDIATDAIADACTGKYRADLGSFNAYTFRIAQNKVNAAWKRAYRRSETSSADESGQSNIPSSYEEPLDYLVRQDCNEQLMRYVNLLPKHQKIAVQLKFMPEQVQTDRTDPVFEASQSTWYVRLCRALKLLRKLMSSKSSP